MELYEVVVLSEARDDINSIADYIKNQFKNEKLPAALVIELWATIRKLDFMPMRFGIVEESLLYERGIRQVRHKQYTIYYVVDEENKFDRGFITFTNKKHMIISEVISPYNWKLLKVDNDVFIRDLPLDNKRLKYLDYHHKSVFKGNYKEKVV